MVSGETTSVLLDGLSPQTEYLVSVYSMTEEKRSRPVQAIDVTCELLTFSRFRHASPHEGQESR